MDYFHHFLRTIPGVLVDMVVIVVVDGTHVLGPEMKLLKSVSIVTPLFRMQSPLDQNDQT